MKKIKNILVPTDFSATSRNAFQYALNLADTLNATVTVVHVKEHLLAASELSVMPHLDDLNTLNAAMASFVDLQDDGGDDAPVMVKTKVKTKILRGFATDELVTCSTQNDVDLIVMGTTGLQDFLSKIIGTVSFEVANRAHCPVMLVPRDAAWQPIDRIMFAANYQSTAPQTVREITDFAQFLKSKLYFVHVNENKLADDNLMEKIWDELFQFSDPSVAFDMHIIYRGNGDVVEKLSKYAERHEVDVLAFVNKKRSFWQNLMHRSITENMAISTDKPMLVLHFDD